LEEGLAEFYSTLSLEGRRIRLGAPIPNHLALLERSTWMTAAELSSVTRSSPELDRDRTGMFYSQSWALAHMLAASPEYRGRIEAFTSALAAGDPAETAFRNAFGKSLEEALSGLRKYVERPLPSVAVDAPRGMEESEEEATPVAEPGIVLMQADVLMLSGRPAVAAGLLAQLAERFPDSAQAQAGLATLALRDKDFETARRRFARALELGASDGPMLFEYAMLLRDTGAPREEVDAYLEKAVAASPNLAEAHFLLGIRASGQMRFEAAIEHLRRAVEIFPRQVYFWHALAFAYFKIGDAAQSRAAAYRAKNAARSPQELEMAEAAIRLSAPPKPAPRKPSVTTPESWDNPRGDSKIEGRLTQVDCGETARLHVGGTVLEVAHPGRVVLAGTRETKVELRCGPQDAPVLVEYDSVTRNVTRIEFR
jgi:Flp pilus assembly protein TadD